MEVFLKMLHEYRVTIEHDHRQGCHPINVCVTRRGETSDIFEYHGKSLQSGMAGAASAIKLMEINEGAGQ